MVLQMVTDKTRRWKNEYGIKTFLAIYKIIRSYTRRVPISEIDALGRN